MKKGVISVLSALTGFVAGAASASAGFEKQLSKKSGMSDKHLALFLMMNQWVRVKQEGKNLSSYFEENGYHKIAVYGMSYAGETLVNELEGTNIEVAYGIDQNGAAFYTDIDIVTMENQLADVDAIVVTAITYFDEIEEQLGKKVSCPVLSLEEILYEV